MINSRILIFCTVFFFAACSSNDQSDSSDGNEKTERITESTKKGASQWSSESLKLNDGNPWEVNEAVINRVTNMRSMVSEVMGAEQGDYRTLANSLEQQINNLLQYSSVEGPANDVLNKWLRNVNTQVHALREAQDIEKAREIAVDIRQSLAEFNTYFQPQSQIR